MEHLVDRFVDFQVLDHVVLAKHEGVGPNVLNVLERPRVEVVDADHSPTFGEEVIAKVGAEKTCSSGDDGRCHGAGRYRTDGFAAAACGQR